MVRIVAGWLALVFLMVPTEGMGDPDPLQLEMRAGYAAHVRWQNVEGPPEWEGGERPVRRFFRNRHGVGLAPGQFVQVRIPPREKLKVLRIGDGSDGPLTPEDLDISVSDGSGLYAVLQPVSEDGLVFSPGADRPLTARIERPERFGTAIEVAVYVSFTEPPGELAPYRDPVRPPGPVTVLRDLFYEPLGGYRRLAAGNAVRFAVRGPVRLKLESRPIFPPLESDRVLSWRLSVRMDGDPLQTRLFETLPDMRGPVLSDGVVQPAGRLETAYIEAPEGRREVTVESSADLFLRVLAQGAPDYLIASLNAPDPTPRQVREILREEGNGIPSTVATALDLARDNRRREGGMAGAALMRDLAERYPDEPAVTGLAQEMTGIHTFFRNLPPTEKPVGAERRFYRFLPRRLKTIRTRPQHLVALDQHRDALLDAVPGAHFIDLDGALTYRLPERFAPGTLRIACLIREGETAGFSLTMDEGPPLIFRQRRGPRFPETAYHSSLGDIGLALSRMRRPDDDAGTLGGPFGAERTPGPLVRAGLFEAPLPAGVRSIRVIPDAERSGRAAVALQYRASAFHGASETAYLAMVDRVTGGDDGDGADRVADLFMDWLTETSRAREAGTPAAGDGAKSTDPSVAALRNQWIPVVRLLAARAGNLASGPKPAKSETPPDPLPADAVSALIQKAEKREAEGLWVNALEAWTAVFHGSEGNLRRRARFARIRALRALGEYGAVDRMLTHLLRFSDDPEETRRAFDLLRERYVRQNDHDGLIGLYAFSLIEGRPGLPSRDRSLGALARLLNARGEYRAALLLSLATPRFNQDPEVLLRAAFHQRWRLVFETALSRLSSETTRHRWLGHRECREGRYRKAQAHFHQAGPEGRRWADALETALAIRRDLRSAEPDDGEKRAEAAVRWVEWDHRHPGPRIWRDADAQVLDFAGVKTLYSVSRDLYSEAFVGRPDRPVAIRVIGPAVLRADLRPLHPAAADAEYIEGWAYLETSAERRLIPVNRNFPSEGLRLIDDSGQRPGWEVAYEYNVPPGVHDIAVYGDPFPVLARFHLKSPDIRIDVLPPLTPETLGFAPTPPKAAGAAAFHPFPRCSPEGRLFVLRREEPRSTLGLKTDALYADLRHPNAFATAAPLSLSPSLPFPLSYLHTLGRRLSDNDIDAALADPPAGKEDEAAVRQYMALLAWVAERQPDRYAGMAARSERFFADHAHIRGLKPLLSRITRQTGWSRASFIQSSAGIRYLPIEGWRPQSRGLRISKALLPPLAPDEHLLYDPTELNFYMANFRPAELSVRLEAEDAGIYPPEPMRVRWGLDDGQDRILTLTPGDPIRFALPVPRGEHTLRIGIVERVENQFLRVRVREAGAPRGRTPGPQPFIEEETRRAYQVATPKEPLEIDIEGPAWVRIDERRGDETLSRYRRLRSGWAHFALRPAPGRGEALYRVFVKTPETADASQPAVRVVRRPPPAVETQCIASLRPGAIGRSPIRTIESLDGQEDGTHTASWQWRRRGESEGASGAAGAEDFFEAAVDYRFLNDDGRSHFHGRGLVRVRNAGGPTLGASSSFRLFPDWLPFLLQAEGDAYWQQPAGLGKGDLETSVRTALTASHFRRIGPKTHHVPTFSVFGRYLSMEDDGGYGPGRVDRDIHTDYKQDHRFGLRLSDALSHRPWLDTLWRIGGRVALNENLNPIEPDHIRLTAEWRQAAGDVYLQGRYRFTHYFADDDRNDSADEHRVGGEIVWEKRIGQTHRLEIGLDLSHEFPSDETLGAFRFAWHFDRGRGYRDFRDAEVGFKDLRSRKRHRWPGP